MRRGTLLFILTLLLLIGGIAFGGRAVMDGVAAGHQRLPVLPVASGLLLMLATGSAMLAGLIGRRGERRLVEQLQAQAAAECLNLIEAPGNECSGVARAVNELIQRSDQNVSEARLKAKELEIQLKIADAERQHAQAIIYSISDAVLVTDPFDEVVLANESAARTFNFELDKAFRSPVDHVLHDAKVIELIREMRQSDSRGGRRIVEHTIQTAAGSRTFKITLSCVADQRENEASVPAGVVAVLHDMTKEKEVSEMKNDFVSNVSHELRTPLASIKAYIEMLIDGEADNERTEREFYDVIQNEANRLGRLIDNILNISRIESGLVKVNKLPQSLTVIMKEALEVIGPQAKGKTIVIKEQLTPVFYQTLADKDMLYQAVLNLLSNAVKYTPEGGSITVETLVDESKKKVLTKITDTGVGIPPKDLPFVFDKFYRAEANNRMAKGTGLGLSLVKHIIETVHKGHILLESQVGKGSSFGFELDLCE